MKEWYFNLKLGSEWQEVAARDIMIASKDKLLNTTVNVGDRRDFIV